MKKLKGGVLWLLSIFLIIMGISIFSVGGRISFFLFAFAAVGCCPFVIRKLKQTGKMPKLKFYIPIIVALVFAGIMTVPTSNALNQNISATSNLDKTAVEYSENVSENDTIATQIVNDLLVETKSESQPISNMKVSFIDVGQADSILIESAGQFMLVDAGNNADSTTIINYLKSQGVTKLQYVIGTHPHEDHIGSLDSVINTFDIATIIMPEVTSTTDTFNDVITSISNKGLSITKPVVGTSYDIGNANFTIIAPNDTYGTDYNNWSVGIKLVNCNNSFVMCGDAEIEAEYDITSNGIDLSADVLKTGHHGSATSTSEAMLKAVNPKYAVISVGEGNSYGHPTEQTLNRLKEAGIDIYRTDEQGTIIATSDGNIITWNCAPSTSMKTGTNTGTNSNTSSKTIVEPATVAETMVATVEATTNNIVSETTAPEEVTEKTVAVNAGNDDVQVHITKSGEKYHRAGCKYLSKSDIVVTLSQAKAKGLTPCSVCNPPQ